MLADLTILNGANTNNASVDGAGNAVSILDVELRKRIVFNGGVILKILLGRSINDVADDETLDGLILRDATGAVHATNVCDVTATVLGSTVVPALGGHLNKFLLQSKLSTLFFAFRELADFFST